MHFYTVNSFWYKHYSNSIFICFYSLWIILLSLKYSYAHTIFFISSICHKCSIQHFCKMLIRFFYKKVCIYIFINRSAIFAYVKVCLIVRTSHKSSNIFYRCFLFYKFKLCNSPCVKYWTFITRIIKDTITTTCRVCKCI